MEKVPKLCLSTFISEEEEVKNEWLKNINVMYNVKFMNNFTNAEELKYYNKLYEYKLKLANKDIMLHLSDEDLIQLNQNDTNIIHLQLVPYIPKLKQRSKSCGSKTKLSPSQRSKTADTDNKSKLSKLTINNNDYIISYKLTKASFNLFKFEKNKDCVKCFGILDEQAKLGSTAIHYSSTTVDNFEFIYSKPLFSLPLYIITENTFTLEQFINSLPKNLNF